MDHEDRVSDVRFQTVPHIGKITAFCHEEAQIIGSIKVELTLQTQIHGIDHEETVPGISDCICKFVVDVTGAPRTTPDLTSAKIRALDLILREFSIK